MIMIVVFLGSYCFRFVVVVVVIRIIIIMITAEFRHQKTEEETAVRDWSAKEAPEAGSTSEHETTTFNPVVPAPWRYILDAGALLLLVILGFLFGFFG